jgi:site-specific DNA recombinase
VSSRAAVVYLRVSTAVQEREGASLDAQELECKRYLREKRIRCVHVVREQVSGRKETLDRPGLLEALEVLERGDANVLCVWALDRFSRNLHSATDLIHRFFGEGRDHELLVATEEIDTRTAGGRMLLNIKLSVAQYEAERTAERIRAVKAYQRENGCYQGGHIPYGYRLSERSGPRGETLLALDRREQAVIRLAVRLRDRGLSLRRIAGLMEDKGITNRQGRQFDSRQIQRLVERGRAQD